MGSLKDTMLKMIADEQAEQAALKKAYPAPEPHVLTLSKEELPRDELATTVIVDAPDSLKRTR